MMRKPNSGRRTFKKDRINSSITAANRIPFRSVMEERRRISDINKGMENIRSDSKNSEN